MHGGWASSCGQDSHPTYMARGSIDDRVSCRRQGQLCRPGNQLTTEQATDIPRRILGSDIQTDKKPSWIFTRPLFGHWDSPSQIVSCTERPMSAPPTQTLTAVGAPYGAQVTMAHTRIHG